MLYICTVSREPLHPLQDIDQPSRCGRYTVFHTRSNMRIYHEDRRASLSICPAPEKYVPVVSKGHRMSGDRDGNDHARPNGGIARLLVEYRAHIDPQLLSWTGRYRHQGPTVVAEARHAASAVAGEPRLESVDGPPRMAPPLKASVAPWRLSVQGGRIRGRSGPTIGH